MKTRSLMMASSLALGLAGLLALFAPDELLGTAGVGAESNLPVILQLLGSLYFALAFINWSSKDSRIGGIYLRPISLGNFAHFFVGALVLGKYALANSQNGLALALMSVYSVFAYFFWWLVFRSTGDVPVEADDVTV
ncbi:MAG: hypothetical protein NTW32_16570 [Chloroflexi bacterium]|nr:hypothetical protein [Chloroflexota bacterium]